MFSPADKSTACGIWSSTYMIALAVSVCLIALALFLSRKMSFKGIRITIFCMFLFSFVTEIIKIVFKGLTYGVEEIEYAPLYFCSLFIYSTFLACLKNEVLKNTGLAFLFFGGIIGAVAFFLYPNACIPSYPIYHFMCLRTMLFHSSMIYTGILIVMRGYYKPNIKHFWNYLVFTLIIAILAYILNLTTGKNYMYMSKPLDIEILKNIYNAVPHLYPILFVIGEIVIPFWISYGIYALIHFLTQRKKTTGEKNYVHN